MPALKLVAIVRCAHWQSDQCDNAIRDDAFSWPKVLKCTHADADARRYDDRGAGLEQLGTHHHQSTWCRNNCRRTPCTKRYTQLLTERDPLCTAESSTAGHKPKLATLPTTLN